MLKLWNMQKPLSDPHIIVGISGASGSIYGLTALKILNNLSVTNHLVITKSGERTLKHECNMGLQELKTYADTYHPIGDVGATIASGSFQTHGMIIAPCSVTTFSKIAHGITDTLITRAADVTLKEKRPLVLMVRETPLHHGHLETLSRLSLMGAVIAPPLPAFYTTPKTLDDVITETVKRALDPLLSPLGLDAGFPRWGG